MLFYRGLISSNTRIWFATGFHTYQTSIFISAFTSARHILFFLIYNTSLRRLLSVVTYRRHLEDVNKIDLILNVQDVKQMLIRCLSDVFISRCFPDIWKTYLSYPGPYLQHWGLLFTPVTNLTIIIIKR